MKKGLMLIAGMFLLLGCGAPEQEVPAQPTEAAGDYTENYTAVDIEVKDYGTITLHVFPECAPKTAENFLQLAEDGFYDGLTFHRIMAGFMIQGGDPEGNGTGGSGKTIVGEFAQNGFDNPLSHVRGTVSMARAKNPDSASSQFFICVGDPTYLDGQYAAFGTVSEGMDVVDRIAEDARPLDNNGTIAADEQPVILSVKVRK